MNVIERELNRFWELTEKIIQRTNEINSDLKLEAVNNELKKLEECK